MDTRILGTTDRDLMQAGEMLREGKLVAFPTETVYGLGADALNPDAVGKVYAAKGRPSDNPMIVHISEKEDILKLTYTVTEDMQKLMDAFWPGPLTMVCPARDIIPKVTTGGLSTVAIRMPSNEVARKLIAFSECPIAAPSANLSGKPSPTMARHCMDDLDGRIDCIIDGDDCKVGIESTVVDMTQDIPMVLRPGIITREELSGALGKKVTLDPTLTKRPDMFNSEDFKPKAPGMKYKHYAPDAEMIIYSGDRNNVELAISLEREKREKEGFRVETIVFDEKNPEEAAHEIFKRLRACDKKDVDVILAAALSPEGVGFSVMNRMLKSAGYNIVEV